MTHTNKIQTSNMEYTLYNGKYKQWISLTIYILPSLLQNVILGSFLSWLPWYFTQYLSLSLSFSSQIDFFPLPLLGSPSPFFLSFSYSLSLYFYPSSYPVPFQSLKDIFLYQLPHLLILEF